MKRILYVALLAAVGCGADPTAQVERFRRAPPPSALLKRALVMGGTPLCGVAATELCQDDAHASHAAYMERDLGGANSGFCNNCHVGWSLDWFGEEFNPQGVRRPAFTAPTVENPNPPRPTFNGWSMTGAAVTGVYNCSNIACHSVPGHTYSYWVQGGDGEAALMSVDVPRIVRDTPTWQTPDQTCSACHDLRPGTGAWHRNHANNTFSTSNECSLCHANVRGTVATRLYFANPALHGNGSVEVQARWKTSCFNCH